MGGRSKGRQERGVWQQSHAHWVPPMLSPVLLAPPCVEGVMVGGGRVDIWGGAALALSGPGYGFYCGHLVSSVKIVNASPRSIFHQLLLCTQMHVYKWKEMEDLTVAMSLCSAVSLNLKAISFFYVTFEGSLCSVRSLSPI